jgi:hypothetical protein
MLPPRERQDTELGEEPIFRISPDRAVSALKPFQVERDLLEGRGQEVVAIEGRRHCADVARSDHIVGVHEDQLPDELRTPTLVA